MMQVAAKTRSFIKRELKGKRRTKTIDKGGKHFPETGQGDTPVEKAEWVTADEGCNANHPQRNWKKKARGEKSNVYGKSQQEKRDEKRRR